MKEKQILLVNGGGSLIFASNDSDKDINAIEMSGEN